MITFIDSFIEELEHESIGTKKMLALVPEDKLAWKPHPKSMSMRDLAIHIADLPSWITLALTTDGIDFATTPYKPKDCKNGEELNAYYDANAEIAKGHLKKSEDNILLEPWIIRSGEDIYANLNRLQTLRHTYCQIVHHRAQLGVYLRLLEIPIPGVYGPSADEA